MESKRYGAHGQLYIGPVVLPSPTVTIDLCLDEVEITQPVDPEPKVIKINWENVNAY